MHIHRDRNSRTLRQWLKLGYVPRPDATGTEMWSNGYCENSFVYYRSDEVMKAAPDEIRRYREPELAVQRERARLRRMEIRRKKEFHNTLARAAESATVPVFNPTGIVVFDTETTGLNPYSDEIIQFSACDGDGKTLLNTYIRPVFHDEWSEASKVNNIYPETVKDAPTIDHIAGLIKGVLASADRMLIGYNTGFDLAFIGQFYSPSDDVKIIDVMEMFALIYGEWNDYYGDYKWQSLGTAANYYNYKYKAHDSMEDVKATLFVYQKLTATGRIKAE